MVFYLLSLKTHPQLSKKVSSVVTKIKFGQNWQKVGNYFKRHWFLGKVVLVKNAQISLEKQF
jgi:hypothetical protein